MTPLFSETGLERLASFLHPGVLCVFDFDGTLAPIVASPDHARLPEPVRSQLQALQQRTPVAILTGRALSDIRSRLDFEANFVIGNHGLEGLPDSAIRRDYFETLCSGWREALLAAFASDGRHDAAIVMEDKQISLSIHYRHVADRAVTEARLQALFATLTPAPRVIAGKCVFNLLPQAAGDKGTAFGQLMRISGAARAIYVGDDVTDEDVFCLDRPDLLSIRVGDAPDSAAQFYLRRYNDITRLLEHLINSLQPAESVDASGDQGQTGWPESTGEDT
jgi:trehalose 6-phosphate phosphatase